MQETTTNSIETDKKAVLEGTPLASLWIAKIKRAKEDEKEWREQAHEALKIYEADAATDIAFNILHSNVETVLPAVYNSSPVPDVRRRYGDPDPVAKEVVDITERLISYCIDQYDFDGEMSAAIRDSLVAGRGAVRIRYDASYKQDQTIDSQKCWVERVPWDKFIRGPSRSWHAMPWIAFEHDLVREELVKLNPKLGDELDVKSAGSGENKESRDADKLARGLMKTAKVYEIWDKRAKQVLFVAEDMPDEPLKIEKDPLGLPDFYPVPRPLQPSHRPTSLTPICPYHVYKPLIDELDAVTKRISKLVRHLKVRGLVDADMSKDFESMKSLADGQFQPAENAARFAGSSSGMEGAVWIWPMEPTVLALQQLYLQRDQIKQTIYEVTGISDIVRGASQANETATAQQIKSQWGSLRVQALQADVARSARDLFRMKAAVFSKHYQPQVISAMTGLPQNEQQAQVFPQAMQLFKSGISSFRIDIETDSTIRADMTRNQQRMSEFLAGSAQFFQSAAGVFEAFGAQALPVLTEVYTAFARQHKLGKQAEDALDQLTTLANEAQQAQQQEPPPDPAVEKAKLEMQMMQQRAQMDGQKQQSDMQMAQAKAQLEAQSLQMKAAHEERMAQLREQEMMLDIEIKEAELAIKLRSMEIDIEAKQVDAEFGAQANAQKLDTMKQQAAMKTNGNGAQA